MAQVCAGVRCDVQGAAPTRALTSRPVGESHVDGDASRATGSAKVMLGLPPRWTPMPFLVATTQRDSDLAG
jgi:hypothetical protein